MAKAPESRRKRAPNRTMSLFTKNLKSAVRDKQQLVWLIGYPLLFTFVFWLAFSGTATRSTYTIAVINYDTIDPATNATIPNANQSWQANLSIMMLDVLDNNTSLNDTFHIVKEINGRADFTYDQALEQLKQERLDAIIILDYDFSENIIGNTWWYQAFNGQQVMPGQLPEPVFSFLRDVNNTNFKNVAPQVNVTSSPDPVTSNIISALLRDLVNTISLRYNNASEVSIHEERVNASDIRRISFFDYLAPGFVIAGTLIAISSLGAYLAEEKEQATLYRLDSTPASRSEILISHTLAQLVITTCQIALVLVILTLIGTHWHPNANFGLLVVTAIIFTFTSLGLGMIIASTAKSAGAAGGFSWFIILPMQFLGGLFFQMGNPNAFDVTDVIPAAYAASAMRKVGIYGLCLADIWVEWAVCIITGIVAMGIGLLLFSRKTKSR